MGLVGPVQTNPLDESPLQIVPGAQLTAGQNLSTSALLVR
jgi:hypothetical protein